jgi:hypothetical protein
MKTSSRERIYGVDFSGAKDAGKRIWIASGTAVEETLQIEACHPAEDLPGSTEGRAAALYALGDLVANDIRSAVGLDFPFGLPRALVDYDRWESFVLSFPQDYPGPEAFREACREAAGGRELRRLTDEAARTPFSPYNIRLYRQTYYGIRDLLHPIVERNEACVLPMQDVAEDRPWLLEICPASTLKQAGLYRPYKGSQAERRSARRHILQAFERKGIASRDPALWQTVVDDAGGDALDSVIAALTTLEALRTPPSPDPKDNDTYAVEGFVYVTKAA